MKIKRLTAWLFKNYLIKIVSLAFAVILWIHVHSGGRVEMNVAVPVEYINVPTPLAAVGDGVEDVKVRIIGPEGVMRNLTLRNLRAQIDLSRAKAGENILFISPDSISLPPDLEVTRIEPQELLVQLEPMIRKEVHVTPIISGTPAPGFQIQRVVLEPFRVRIEGPSSILETIHQVNTEPIDVTGAAADFERDMGLDMIQKEISVDRRNAIRVRVVVSRRE